MGSKKILIGVVAVVAIAGTGYYFGIAKPQQHLAEQKAVYEEAQDLIDEGKYDKAIEKLNSIIDYDGAQDAINEAETGKEKATYVTTPCDQDGIYNACVHFDWIKEKD